MKIEKTTTGDRDILREERDTFAAALELLFVMGVPEEDLVNALRAAKKLVL